MSKQAINYIKRRNLGFCGEYSLKRTYKAVHSKGHRNREDALLTYFYGGSLISVMLNNNGFTSGGECEYRD